ncbi:unnamed protein product, partial [Symbiodinium microadriaticum]
MAIPPQHFWQVLGQFVRRERRNSTRSGTGPAIPGFVAKLVPALVHRLLEQLELLSAEDMLCAWSALSADLCYSDDYLCDRFSNALMLRIFPVRGEAHAAALGQALACAASSAAPFAELLRAGVEELHGWDREDEELKQAMCRSLALDVQELSDGRASSWTWLQQMRRHYTNAAEVLSPAEDSWVLTASAVEDLCSSWHAS